MPASFVVQHNIAELEREASSREGIGAANGRLGGMELFAKGKKDKSLPYQT